MLATSALVHRKLESEFSAKAAKGTTEMEGGGELQPLCIDAFVYSRGSFSVFINTSAYFKTAAFTVFLNALGRGMRLVHLFVHDRQSYCFYFVHH